MGKNLNVRLGTRDLTPERKAEYGVKDNGTHMSLAIPFLASDVAFEVRIYLNMTLFFFFL